MKKFLVPIVSVVALVVGLINLFSNHTPQAPTPGGVVNVVNGGSTFTNGADFGGPAPVTMNWAGDKIRAKSNQAFWRNTTGMTQYVDLAEFSTDGTASSTYKVYAGTTTSATALNDFSAPALPALINGFLLATSSLATTTSNINYARASSVVQVPDGKYVYFQFQAVDDRNCPATKLCETATSTNRGFNGQWRLRYHN